MQENLLEWEEDYKLKHIHHLRESLKEELKLEFEVSL